MEPENEWWHPRHEPTSITIFRLGVGVEAISSESREWMEQWNAIKLRKLCNILISSELRHERSICAINVTSPKPLKTVTWNPLIATWDDATRSGLRMQFAWQHSNSMMKAATLVALSSPSCGMLRKDKWNNFLCKTRTEMRRWRRNSEEMMLQSASRIMQLYSLSMKTSKQTGLCRLMHMRNVFSSTISKLMWAGIVVLLCCWNSEEKFLFSSPSGAIKHLAAS